MHQGVFQTSDDCPIAYTLRAARNPGLPRIVLIHSLALDASIWDGVVTRLAVHADILTYDCRGHGRSGKLAPGFTMARFARDLMELLDHVGWQSAVAAGCSMGGCVAQALAGLYHTRVSALGLIDTTAWYGEDAPAIWRERAAGVRSKGLVGLLEFQLTRWFGDDFRKQNPELVDAATEVFLANDLDCYAASCIMLGDTDLRDYLKKLSVPAAIIVGEEDYATPVDDAQQLHDAIPNSTLTIIPRARHLTPIECPEEIAIQLIALLGRV
ncbi:MAG TPA: alpha/beta fold hydrolase [Bryobacteraceae bacterium]|jgi:3-oxoadipate enol-lactonase|nr:alpha/beta fold hydrolase [Bryobacteraceae bacterium]